ncbi:MULTISPECIES: MBL fold metallo-hydrolase [Saccharibacillus]|uniref:MBL fold metallo-hydrolase n=1 Tax=Saccharibacillus TaxID=456492 RepID=UPI00123BCF0B|nr:MBL fold metallo-hydrolase [Saccharibacillus sp. WB 17]MWJ30737.1 MBL fold metallo-hydrolase [Saccharibacillus sp. WB 17]
MHIQQIRNATVILQYAGQTFLIDPMLAEQGRYEPFALGYGEQLRNPTVELPMPIEQILDGVDAVILTHLHLDHYDEVAKEAIPKTLKMFVQNERDADLIRADGFLDVEVLTAQTRFNGISLIKTQGEHGRGEVLLQQMGDVCGVMFKHADEKTLYLAGDTVWYAGVKHEIDAHEPEVIIVNGGKNSVRDQGALIMGEDDIYEVHRAAPDAALVSVHMEAVNHWLLPRADLKRFAQHKGFDAKLLIPEDGESLVF